MRVASNVRFPWESLTFVPQRRKATTPRKVRDIVAFDTETINGKAWLITDSLGRADFPTTWFEILDWFESAELFRNTLMCWNLDYDVRAILAFLDENTLLELAVTNRYESPEFKLHYVPRKFLTISYHKHRYEIFDLMQYYNSSLDYASEKYLGEGKLEMDRERISKDASFRRKHLKKIIAYGIRDAVLTKRLGDLNSQLYAQMGVVTNKWYSTGYIAGKYFLHNGGIPRYHCADAQRYAYYSYAGGRFECFKRGTFDNAYKYDLTSAYPAVIATLPNIDRGTWTRTTNIDYSADLIFARVRVSTPQQYMQPFHVKHRGVVVYPEISKHYRIMTKPELELIRDFELADIEILEAWHFYTTDPKPPFASIRDMFEQRIKLKRAKDPRQMVLKVVMNSLYGKFIQVTPELYPEVIRKVGNYFIPAYASEITARTRCELVRTVLEKDLDPIAFFTDAIITEDKFTPSGKGLGHWVEEKSGELVLLGCGVYGFNDSENPDTHVRGFSLPRSQNLRELLEKYSTKSAIPFTSERPISLGEFATRSFVNDGHWLNEWVERTKYLRINFDRKRKWARDWSRARDVLRGCVDSMPLQIAV